ncbi:MAG: CRISPR-associated helicase/endonuclease Cas3 [Rhodocyclaceae bacterium]
MSRSFSSALDVLLRYWGKARPGTPDGARFHLLVCHSLDVAAVAGVWWDASPAIRRAFCQTLNLPERACRAWVLYFCALHDLGKFDLRFQLKSSESFVLLNGHAPIGDITPDMIRAFDHGKAGLHWYHADAQQAANPASPPSIEDIFSEILSSPDNTATPWIEAVCGHHGFLFRREWLTEAHFNLVGANKDLKTQDRHARRAWADACAALFLAPLGLDQADAPLLPADFQPVVAGFCSIADWLGSRSQDGLFPYQDTIESLDDYFDQVSRHDAAIAVASAGLCADARPYSGIESLLISKGDSHAPRQPRQVQTLIDDTPLAPGLTLIEGPTGCGKTEAALALAWRLIHAGLADGMVFALPTQATSNAIFERVRTLADHLFMGGANLVLAHGKAAYNPTFTKLKDIGQTVQAAEEAWAQCAGWLASSGKRAFLGQICICTVDQVLVSVLPVKHRFVRGFALSRCVLIIDEVHAYDTYMNALLDEVLQKQRAAGGCAILLSATLPSQRREQIASAWGTQCAPSEDYPLLTWCPNGPEPACARTSRYTSPTPLREVYLECIAQPHLIPDESLLERIVTAAEAGAQIGIICNLADHAQAVFERLRSMTRQPIILFHSRFTFRDRQTIEQSLDGMFGPGGDRSVGRILVSTQVLEQSVDVDVDWLITQLCPVDLLFQRMGRMHRHLRDKRPAGCEVPRCTLLVPDAPDFGMHGKIYDNAVVMWKTWQLSVAQGSAPVVFPEAYRSWIKHVYDSGQENIPDWVGAQQTQFENTALNARSKARLAMKSTTLPVPDTHEYVMAVTRDGETNRALVMYRETQRGRALHDGTLLDTLNDAERGEALSLNTVCVPARWMPQLPIPDENGLHWLSMDPTDEAGATWQAQHETCVFRYCAREGLRRDRRHLPSPDWH